MKEVVILFGEMGAGKNYHGKRMALKKGYPFFDGDRALTPEMKEKVSKFKPVPRELILQFVSELLSVIIEKLHQNTNGLVVAQALYFDEDRRYIEYVLRRLGYTVTFYWVKTSFLRNLKQIYSRPNGFRWVLYWLMSKPWFQKPAHEYLDI